MTRRLRHIIIFMSLAAAIIPRAGSAQNTITLAPAPGAIPNTLQTQKAIAAATDFMNAIVRDSSIDKLMNVCGLPFCHDDSVILTTHAELRSALTLLIAATSRDRARTHPAVDSVYVLNIRREALFQLVPINVFFTVVRLKFNVGGQDASRLLILAVEVTDDAKVVGIED